MKEILDSKTISRHFLISEELIWYLDNFFLKNLDLVVPALIFVIRLNQVISAYSRGHNILWNAYIT